MPPEHVNKTISGKRVFVDAVKDVKVRSRWVWLALNRIRMFLVRDKRRKTDTEDKPHEEEGRDGQEGPQAQGLLEPLKLEKAGRTLSWSLWRDLSPAPPWSQVSGLQDWGRMNSCCFKSPNMWSSVREATENTHRPCSVGS